MNIRLRVGAVIVKDGSILLAKHKKNEEEYWLLPGGGVDPGESLHEAIIREIKEEVSLDINPGELLFLSDSISPKRDRHIIQAVMRCEILGGELRVNPDHRLCDAKFVSFKDLDHYNLRPNIKPDIIPYLTKTGAPSKVYLGKVWE